MGAVRQIESLTANPVEIEIMTNVFFELGFVHLGDKKVFIKQINNGEYIRISFSIHNTIKSMIGVFGHSSFDLRNSPEHKRESAKIANRLLQKYNEISE